MASKSHATKIKRRLKRRKSGAKRKNALNNKGSTRSEKKLFQDE